MGFSIDLEQLSRVFGRSGERVVLVMPGQDPIVLVPLEEYEKLKAKPQAVVAKAQVQPRNPAALASETGAPVEAVDPLQGGVEDDNQYFPEPLE